MDARDLACVCCGSVFKAENRVSRERVSWEHIVNDAPIITSENIAIGCMGCNASKRAKALAACLQSPYCNAHGITPERVAPVVRAALAAGRIAGPSLRHALYRENYSGIPFSISICAHV